MTAAMQKTKKFKKAKEEMTVEAAPYEYAKDNRVHKYKAATQDRAGDWTCHRCQNHNFSFREVCNMCSLSQTESQSLSESVSQGPTPVVFQMGTPFAY